MISVMNKSESSDCIYIIQMFLFCEKKKKFLRNANAIDPYEGKV